MYAAKREAVLPLITIIFLKGLSMVYFIGLDDTDTIESRGTGQLARMLAVRLSSFGEISGVTRHQLLFDDRIAYTKNNSSAVIHLESNEPIDHLADRIQEWMLAEFIEGSDPGLCLAGDVPPQVIHFGWQAKRELIRQEEARQLAADYGVSLSGLGGDGSGIIGALAAVGLAASGEDGRYIELGNIRALSGLQPIEKVLAAGVARVITLQDEPIESGMVMIDKLRPSRRSSQPVAYVERLGDVWQALKID